MLVGLEFNSVHLLLKLCHVPIALKLFRVLNLSIKELPIHELLFFLFSGHDRVNLLVLGDKPSKDISLS